MRLVRRAARLPADALADPAPARRRLRVRVPRADPAGPAAARLARPHAGGDVSRSDARARRDVLERCRRSSCGTRRIARCRLWAWVGLRDLDSRCSLGYANMPMLLVLWAIYGSYERVGQIWFGFGWEIQLLETTLLCAALAHPWDPRPLAARSPPTTSLVLLRWLVFRIMLGAGLIKLRGDPCWRDLTCLDHALRDPADSESAVAVVPPPAARGARDRRRVQSRRRGHRAVVRVRAAPAAPDRRLRRWPRSRAC